MHPAAMERAGYWFREVSVPEPAASRAPADAPQPAEAQSAEARSAEARSTEAQSAEPWPEPTQAEIDAEAERYAVIYPDRAARIRAAGGLPVRLDFGPPEPAIVAALLRDLGGPERSARGISCWPMFLWPMFLAARDAVSRSQTLRQPRYAGGLASTARFSTRRTSEGH
jgi:hypothetical protein